MRVQGVGLGGLGLTVGVGGGEGLGLGEVADGGLTVGLELGVIAGVVGGVTVGLGEGLVLTVGLGDGDGLGTVGKATATQVEDSELPPPLGQDLTTSKVWDSLPVLLIYHSSSAVQPG